MQDYVENCIINFCALTGTVAEKIKPKPTPFIDESKDPCPVFGEEEPKTWDATKHMVAANEVARRPLVTKSGGS